MKKHNKKSYDNITFEQRRNLFLSRCFLLCPKCWTVHPLGTKTCSSCMEVLDPKERIFQKNLNKYEATNRKHFIELRMKNENIK